VQVVVGKIRHKPSNAKMMLLWVHVLFPLVANSHADAGKNQKYDDIQHHNVQKPSIIYVVCYFFS
jgi:hypothetical protein